MEQKKEMDQDLMIFYNWLTTHSQTCYDQGVNDTLKGCIVGMIGGIVICTAVDVAAEVLIPTIKEKLHNKKNQIVKPKGA